MVAHILASGARLSGFIPAAGEETFWCPNMLSLVSFAGMTLNKRAVLWIGTLTGGPVQGESPLVLVKESHIQTYSRTSVCGRTYLGVVWFKLLFHLYNTNTTTKQHSNNKIQALYKWDSEKSRKTYLNLYPKHVQ